MAFDLRKLLGLDAPHAQPHAAAQAQLRNSQPIQAPAQPQVAAQLQNPVQNLHSSAGQVGTWGIQRPLGLGSYQQDSPWQVPLQNVSPNVLNGPIQGSGSQFQPSWDNPEDIYRSNRY